LLRRKLAEVLLNDRFSLSLPDRTAILVQGFRSSGALDPLYALLLLVVVVLRIRARGFLLLGDYR
jgi:hypothetical protein